MTDSQALTTPAVGTTIQLPADIPEERRERIRVAVERASRDRGLRGFAISERDKANFVDLITAGCDVDDAAAITGRACSAMFEARRRDPDFAARWAAAYEARTAPIVRRLEEWTRKEAADGMPTMAQVRSAEVLLKAHHPALQQQRPSSATATMTAPNGAALTVRLAPGGE